MEDSNDSLRERFRSPPASEFGNIPFWWWDGDCLDTDRITAQLEALAERGVEAVCFEQKYPHGSPKGPQTPYFSEEWWTYIEHAVAECERLEMRFWLHDETYHHSPPTWKRYWQDQIEERAADDPELQGRVLDRFDDDLTPGETVTFELAPEFEVLVAAAYPRRADGALDTDAAISLAFEDRHIEWTAPDDGEWHVSVIGTRSEGLCRTTRAVVDRLLTLHYDEYVERFGETLGEAIAGTFQDELYMLQGTVPCDERLLDRYRTKWGDDPVPELIALFEDCGPGTHSFRTRYYDVVTTMLEENWFKPLYEWHVERDLQFAHDNWGRNDLTEHATEYGDYFRTMRWFQVPGYDDGGRFEGVGTRNFFDAKLASSIATCYDRDRVWGELFHTTGWGFSPELQLAGLVENACYGLTKYNMHGLYYATLGGWYEHAPPDTHFRQPYWEQYDGFNHAVRRLMYLLSRGDPVVDLAVFYPIASIQAHRLATGIPEINAPGGRHSVDFEPEGPTIDEDTRTLTEELYDTVADLLFVDHQTLDTATTSNGKIEFAGIDASVFVLGPMTTVRRAVLDTAVSHVRSGGVVVSAGGLPSATVEGGPTDPLLDDALTELFGSNDDAGDKSRMVDHQAGGVGILVPDATVDDLRDVLTEYVALDVDAPDDIYHVHRRIGDHEIYLLLNTQDEYRTAEVDLRAVGQPECWDILDGTVEPIHTFERDDTYTTLEIDFGPYGFHVVGIDTTADSDPRVMDTSLMTVSNVTHDGDDLTVEGHAADAGTQHVTALADGETYASETPEPISVPDPVALDTWTFEVSPTLDNEWGDFRYPANDDCIGPEVRSFRWQREAATADTAMWTASEYEDDDWSAVRWSYGPRFWRRTARSADPDRITTPDENATDWSPFVFSERIGTQGTHHDDHGLSGTVSDDFLVAPAGENPVHFWTTVRTDEACTTACHFGADIRELQVGGDPVPLDEAENGTVEIKLSAGATTVHLVVAPDTRTHLAFEHTPATATDRDMDYTPRLRWFHGDALHFDHRPWETQPVSWFRFSLPAGTTAFTVPIVGDARVWVAGEEHSVDGGHVTVDAHAEPRTVAIRVASDDGAYAGAVWTGPVAIETTPVEVSLGDWCDLGLDAYSGIGVYRTTARVPEHGDGRVILDLGDIAVSASVWVNGEKTGTTFSRPHELDVTDAVTVGENEIEVRVANTIANHFATEVPTRYVYDGQIRSGLLGPVELRVRPGITVHAER